MTRRHRERVVDNVRVVAYSLLSGRRVWFALDGKEPEHVGLEQVLARLQAIVRFTDDLGRRFGDAGLGSGVGDVVSLYRRLKATLDAIPDAEIARLMDEARVLTQGLTAIEHALAEVKRLKVLVGG